MHPLLPASLFALLLQPLPALAPDDQEVAEARKNLMDKDPIVRVKAAQALGKLGARAAPAAADLVRAVKEKDFTVRVAATQALRAIGPDAVPALADGLKDDDINVRRTLLAVLQMYGD